MDQDPTPLPLLAYDTETTGLRLHYGDRMFAFSTCAPDGTTEIRRKDRKAVEFFPSLRRAWDGEHNVVMHHAKFDIKATRNEGIEIPDGFPFEDTMLMAAVLFSHLPRGLKDLAYILLGYPQDDERSILKASGPNQDFSRVPHNMMEEYQRHDAERTMLLCLKMLPKIRENIVFSEIYEIEKALVWTTLRMEDRGLLLNERYAKSLVEDLTEKRESCLSDLPFGFNPASAKDVTNLLYHELNLPILKRTPSGNPATDKVTLFELDERFPDCKALERIVAYRAYDHGIAIISSYLGFQDRDHVVHPNINTVGAHTGRESCSEPNLQNVQSEGRLLNRYPVPARRCFMPRPGHVNFHIDYSGIEMRLIIHESRDPEMVRIMKSDKPDPHSVAASVFFRAHDRWAKADPVEKKMLRSAAKNGQFCIAYGGGAPKLARTLNIPVEEAQTALGYYRERFPGIFSLNKQLASKARRAGFIETTFGHRITVDPQKAYTATNFIIQGTAAGILKRAQVRVDRLLQKDLGGKWQILLPVHDEIIIECPRSMLPDSKRILRMIREEMIGFPQFSVPLEVEVEVSTASWADLEEVNINDDK